MPRPILMFLCLGLMAGCSTPRSLNGFGPGGGEKLAIGEAFSLSSSVLGESRGYSVYLPRAYDAPYQEDKRYPVLYLPDGNVHFQTATGVVSHMGPHQTPDMIVVGIDNALHRSRDLSPTESRTGPFGGQGDALTESGGGDAFLQFLREELIPEIEGTYRTTEERVLVGHSAGGLLAMHALLNAPEIFDAYVAIDPSLWWDDALLVKQAAEVFVEGHGRSARVHLSYADQAIPRGQRRADGNPPKEAILAFGETLDTAQTPEFSFSMAYFEDENHGSIPLIGLYQGLQAVTSTAGR